MENVCELIREKCVWVCWEHVCELIIIHVCDIMKYIIQNENLKNNGVYLTLCKKYVIFIFYLSMKGKNQW